MSYLMRCVPLNNELNLLLHLLIQYLLSIRLDARDTKAIERGPFHQGICSSVGKRQTYRETKYSVFNASLEAWATQSKVTFLRVRHH